VKDGSAVWHRPQSLGEEIANCVSHGVGFLAALAAFPALVVGAQQHGAAAVVGAGVVAQRLLVAVEDELDREVADGVHGALPAAAVGAQDPVAQRRLGGGEHPVVVGVVDVAALHRGGLADQRAVREHLGIY